MWMARCQYLTLYLSDEGCIRSGRATSKAAHYQDDTTPLHPSRSRLCPFASFDARSHPGFSHKGSHAGVLFARASECIRAPHLHPCKQSFLVVQVLLQSRSAAKFGRRNATKSMFFDRGAEPESGNVCPPQKRAVIFGEGLEDELRKENASLQHAVKEVRSHNTIRCKL
jgi:hypothetical protein